jgi:general secretion pathway protein A
LNHDLMSGISYESFFGLSERPFSLTPDTKYFFKSRAHGRALESLIFGLRRRDKFLLLSGDLGFGKTTICRTLVEQLRRRSPVAYVPNALLSPADLLRRLLYDFGLASDHNVVVDATSSSQELYDMFVHVLKDVQPAKESAVLILDEAHTTPPAIVDELTRLASITVDGCYAALQTVLAAQPIENEDDPAGIRRLDSEITTRARLLPFGREDCAAYVTHRLTVAGGAGVTFTPRAIDVLFGLSGGVPRLINLLCERALQESAAHERRKIEPAAIEAAATALELLRARRRRFRWFHRRIS